MSDQKTNIKPLPRDESGQIMPYFIANGKEYVILNPDEGIGILRYSLLMKMGSPVGYSATFENQFHNYKKLRDIVNGLVKGKTEVFDLIAHVGEMEKGLVDTSKNRFLAAFHICTLFIIQKGEDMTKWIQSEQEEKIDDWNKEGLNEQDFLFLALREVKGYSDGLKDYLERNPQTHASMVTMQ